MAGFGWSTGDLFALGNLVHDLYGAWKSAPSEYAELRAHLKSFRINVKKIGEVYGEPLPDDLTTILEDAEATVYKLNGIMTRYSELDRDKHRHWDRLRLGRKKTELATLQTRLHQHCDALTTYMTADNRAATERLEHEVAKVKEMIAGYVYRPRLEYFEAATSKSNGLSDEAAWQQIRADLLQSNVDSSFIREQESAIKEYFLDMWRSAATKSKADAPEAVASPSQQQRSDQLTRHQPRSFGRRSSSVVDVVSVEGLLVDGTEHALEGSSNASRSGYSRAGSLASTRPQNDPSSTTRRPSKGAQTDGPLSNHSTGGFHPAKRTRDKPTTNLVKPRVKNIGRSVVSGSQDDRIESSSKLLPSFFGFIPPGSSLRRTDPRARADQAKPEQQVKQFPRGGPIPQERHETSPKIDDVYVRTPRRVEPQESRAQSSSLRRSRDRSRDRTSRSLPVPIRRDQSSEGFNIGQIPLSRTPVGLSDSSDDDYFRRLPIPKGPLRRVQSSDGLYFGDIPVSRSPI